MGRRERSGEKGGEGRVGIGEGRVRGKGGGEEGGGVGTAGEGREAGKINSWDRK